MLENSMAVPKWNKGYIEEVVILKETKNLLKYTLSNSLDTIRTAVFSRTGHNLDLKKTIWKLNPELSISVKHLMNSHNVNYSMTTDVRDKVKFVVINMRAGDNWFITGFDEIEKFLINWEYLRIYSRAVNYTIKTLNDDNDDNDNDKS